MIKRFWFETVIILISIFYDTNKDIDIAVKYFTILVI